MRLWYKKIPRRKYPKEDIYKIIVEKDTVYNKYYHKRRCA